MQSSLVLTNKQQHRPDIGGCEFCSEKGNGICASCQGKVMDYWLQDSNTAKQATTTCLSLNSTGGVTTTWCPPLCPSVQVNSQTDQLLARCCRH